MHGSAENRRRSVTIPQMTRKIGAFIFDRDGELVDNLSTRI
jgi:hypothetical protein